MSHPLSHNYPIPISKLCLVNTDVPAGDGAPPLDTQPLHTCMSVWVQGIFPSLEIQGLLSTVRVLLRAQGFLDWVDSMDQHFITSCLDGASTIYWKTFKGENVCKFRGFVTIREFSPCHLRAWHRMVAPASNLQKFSPWKSFVHQFAKVFSHESFLLYSNF